METPLTDPTEYSQLLESKPNIPKEISRYVSVCLQQRTTNQLIRELQRDPPATATGLDSFFEVASQATGLTPNALLHWTGFAWKDTDPSRITSAMTQLRGIFFLSSQNFAHITPIPASKSKSADLVGILDGAKYAVEVFNSIYNATGRFSETHLAE